ncbi:hypothetical protein LWI28_002456 [Acer negundo]|uniref:Uncharacterized protein n=1 Tax=Acer negundo TaxID=4023 RepID=A0AAD5ND57_ACENE|nr:hypothetical protein LWI28_002456 [Acer negundo]
MDQFNIIIPLPQFRNLGQEDLQIECFLGASQLTEVLKFLKDVVRSCGLSENVEMDESMDVTFAADECQDDVLPERNDIVS